MSVSNSTGFKDAKHIMGQARALTGGVIELRTNPQPADADAASVGTVLGILTLSGGTHTCEVQATHLFDLTGITTAETITSITVAGQEILGATITFATDATTTAALVAAQINRYVGNADFSATSSVAVVTVKAQPGAGITYNDATVVASGTGVWNGAAAHFKSGGVAATATPNTWNSGNGRFAVVAGGGTQGVASVNGLSWNGPASGVMTGNPNETWTCTWLAAGTLQHGRVKGSIADNDLSTTTLIRKDFSIGIVGADMTVSSVTITADMVTTTASLNGAALSITEQ